LVFVPAHLLTSGPTLVPATELAATALAPGPMLVLATELAVANGRCLAL